ncbi:glycosyltransferase [Prosthecobacter sp.]|uniref:glycosyltransferase family 2 protein n=1 Tax=Prosthecobacter sp. TaxID=1965333 RepID=UPI002ABC435D|nr:glycosyltransferase [Prosthecobacter sp.]MDZ4404503.1 glycosyltransferase [Prosthecobacter sp.]
MVRASIIIPTCNRPEDLRRCLQTLQPQLDTQLCEVIVADDSRDERTRQLLAAQFPWVKVIPGPRCGPAANRNAGACHATGLWLIFIDDDVIPEPGFLKAYLDVLNEAGDHGIFHGLTRSMPATSSLLWEAPEVLEKLDLFPSCNFAIRRSLYEQAGGFDERFNPSFEDMEFSSRLKAQGEECRFVPEAAVHHPRRPLPAPGKLARRWETRVISALDLGARPGVLALLLTKHVAMVILSRFRNRGMSWDSARAGVVFAREFAWFIWLLPAWLWKHAKSTRSPFWEMQQALGKAPRRYGL